MPFAYPDSRSSHNSHSTYGSTNHGHSWEYKPGSNSHSRLNTQSSTHTNAHAGYDPIGRYRNVSPLHSQTGSSRQSSFEISRTYGDHRSVSPLGSSRFEGPSPYKGMTGVRRANPVSEQRQMFEQPTSHGYYGNFGQRQNVSEQPMSHGYYGNFGHSRPSQSSGLSRSEEVHGRQNHRGFGTTGYSGGTADPRYDAHRHNQAAANFRNGGFSSYEHY